MIILLWIFKRNNDNKKSKEDDKKLKIKNGSDNRKNYEEESNSHEIINKNSSQSNKIIGPLKKKLVDKSYNPINKEFLREAKKVIKQVNKNKQTC